MPFRARRSSRIPLVVLVMLTWLGALSFVAGALFCLAGPVAAQAVPQPVPESLYQEMHWRSIGPFRGGRTRAVAGVHGDPDTLYIGVGDGGVWRSRNYGRTWTPIFDDQPTQSIGAIAVAPSDPLVLYVASGEGLQRPDLSVGDGIYRSSDGGETWTHLGLRDGQQIPGLAVDPRDPDRVFAAVLGHPYGPNEERGLFRSTDGGATWEKVLYLDEDTGAYDVDIDPENPDTVYATFWQGRQGPWEYGNAYGGGNGGIFKSTDGGDHWTKLGTGSPGGLPETIVQANLAIAPSRPQRLYAILATDARERLPVGRGPGALPLGRRRRHLGERHRRPAAAHADRRRRPTRPRRRPREPGRGLQHVDRHGALRGRRQDLDEPARRAGGRRLPEHLDRPGGPERHPAGRRPGGDRLRRPG